MNNNKDGFILLYSVAIIAVIAVLITSIVTMSAGTNKNNYRLAEQFERRTAIDQIGEYFIADSAENADKIQQCADNHGFTADIQTETTVATLTLRDGADVVLVVTVTGGGESKTVEWRYKAV